VAEPIDELVQGADLEMVAINKVILTLTGVQRTDDKLQFAWNAHNPSQYPTYVHIGIPPVIGTDGVLYGFYETPDIVSVPITPASGNAEWTTEVTIPEDVNGLYIMLSVETGKARLFANYAIDITDQ
jgi:S-formylglutathione hydrolase FrmB